MKPEPQPRASHPDTVDPRWVAGKAVFAALIKGGTTEALSDESLKDALRYSRTVMFPPSGGSKVKLALKAEAKKRNVLV